MTPEQKANLQSIIRYLFIGLGAWFAGKTFAGITIDSATWEGWVGAAAALGFAIWGMVDKTNGLEAVQSAVRSVLTILSTMAVSSGLLDATKVAYFAGIITMLLPFLYSWISRAKSVAIANNTLKISQMAGVKKAA